MKLIILVSPLCEVSLRGAKEARRVAQRLQLEFEELSIAEARGEELAIEKGVKLLPAYVVDQGLVHEGLMEEKELEQSLKGEARVEG